VSLVSKATPFSHLKFGIDPCAETINIKKESMYVCVRVREREEMTNIRIEFKIRLLALLLVFEEEKGLCLEINAVDRKDPVNGWRGQGTILWSDQWILLLDAIDVSDDVM